MAYPKKHTGTAGLTPSPVFPEIERAVLDHWDEHGTFAKSVEQRDAGEDGANEFVFNDGPPFANGLPHYGHLLTGYVKDVVPRYQTMRGKRVERRFGWDTHGLPAELEAMDQLGIKTKDEILELGIEKFNDACRESVLKYTHEWEEYVTRQARWVDFENDYKTLNVGYMESVLWAFKSLYDKGLAYEGFRVLPYCWNDETPLSNHELRMDEEVYQVRRDPAVTVGLRILPRQDEQGMESAGGADPLTAALLAAPDIADPGEAEKGHRVGAKLQREAAHFRETAGEQHGDAVVPHTERGRHAGAQRCTAVAACGLGGRTARAGRAAASHGRGHRSGAGHRGHADRPCAGAADVRRCRPCRAAGAVGPARRGGTFHRRGPAAHAGAGGMRAVAQPAGGGIAPARAGGIDERTAVGAFTGALSPLRRSNDAPGGAQHRRHRLPG